MENETKAILMATIKCIEQVNQLRAESSAIKEAIILLLKNNVNFEDGLTAESFMQAINDKYLEETQPILDNMKALLKI
jgi:hypothetical protein